jgi:hypothetical protein
LLSAAARRAELLSAEPANDRTVLEQDQKKNIWLIVDQLVEIPTFCLTRTVEKLAFASFHISKIFNCISNEGNLMNVFTLDYL